jgi:O-antigen ligase
MFVLWCCASFVWTVDTGATIRMVNTYACLLLFLWMLWEFTDTQRQWLWYLRSYLVGCCVSLAMLFADVLAGKALGASGAIRYTGGGLNPNGLALIVDIGVLLAVYLASHSVSKWRVAYWLFVPPASIGVLLTGSRAGAICLGVALVMALFLAASTSWKSIILSLVLVGGTAWWVPKIVPEDLLRRITEGREAHTYAVRKDQWQAGLRCWEKVPITGVGAGAFVAAVTATGARNLVAHNTFVQILTEDGIIGAGLMIIVWALLTRKVWHFPRPERCLFLGVSVVWLLGASSCSLEYAKVTWILYAWIIVQAELFRSSAVPAPHWRNVPRRCPEHRVIDLARKMRQDTRCP